MRTRIAIVTIVVVVLLAAVHAYSVQLERLARDTSRPLHERSAAAERATRLEPFSERYSVTAAILHAEEALAEGDADRAYFLLLPLSTSVRGDEYFRVTYQRAVAAKWELDARKAHQQHAKEKEGGELAPEDVFE